MPLIQCFGWKNRESGKEECICWERTQAWCKISLLEMAYLLWSRLQMLVTSVIKQENVNLKCFSYLDSWSNLPHEMLVEKRGRRCEERGRWWCWREREGKWTSDIGRRGLKRVNGFLIFCKYGDLCLIILMLWLVV